ncbi:MAG: glycosyl transferase, partial [Pseudorhodobacter sp.]|nr:glycosyl transferase [Frankiaceae bacterium]
GAPGWRFRRLGGSSEWVPDPWPVLCSADVVVTHAGQNALAEVATARVPALVVPAPRPFDEQVTTARQLAAGPWPCVTRDRLDPGGAADLLDEVRSLDGSGWSTWCDGGAADRFADVVDEVLGATPSRVSA